MSPLNKKVGKERHPYFWFWIWFGAAAAMLVIVTITNPAYQVIGLCFFAWCGGIVFDRMIQERFPDWKINSKSTRTKHGL